MFNVNKDKLIPVRTTGWILILPAILQSKLGEIADFFLIFLSRPLDQSSKRPYSKEKKIARHMVRPLLGFGSKYRGTLQSAVEGMLWEGPEHRADQSLPDRECRAMVFAWQLKGGYP
jgi:hypothetical protein